MLSTETIMKRSNLCPLSGTDNVVVLSDYAINIIELHSIKSTSDLQFEQIRQVADYTHLHHQLFSTTLSLVISLPPLVLCIKDGITLILK